LIDQAAGHEPGYSEIDTTFTATNLSNVVVPVPAAGVPLAPVPITGGSSHTLSLYGYQGNLRTPYTQNYNFTITRALPHDLTMTLAYVGSSSHELVQTADTNEVNIYENGLLNAFNTVLGGGDSPLIDRIFNASLGSGYAKAMGTATGSQFVLSNSATQGFFTTNNPGGFANYISTTNALSGVNGGLLPTAGLPANFIVANPQYLHTYLIGNLGNATYNSLQVSIARRFSRGFSFQTNYVWSKDLGVIEGDTATFSGSYRTLRNESLDKRPLSFDYESVWKANGVYEFPFGKGKQFGGNVNGFVDRIINGWQLGVTALMYSGQPLTFTAQNTINNTSSLANFTANLLGPMPADGATRTNNGVIYFPGLTQIVDPSVANMPASLRALSTLRAIATNGQPLIVNPLPGVMGSLGEAPFRGPGSKNLNINLIKHIRINERFTAQIGASALNATNTPTFGNPNTSINSTAFGRITSTGGYQPWRLIVLQARINF
jgi:hypothetical protein